jgi:dipeptidyl aminopeptidase/acylaminoacyl peptidase
LLHGDQDPQMPINQSHELHGVAKENGLTTHFEVVHGAGHGGEAFFDAARTDLAAQFLAAAFAR